MINRISPWLFIGASVLALAGCKNEPKTYLFHRKINTTPMELPTRESLDSLLKARLYKAYSSQTGYAPEGTPRTSINDFTNKVISGRHPRETCYEVVPGESAFSKVPYSLRITSPDFPAETAEVFSDYPYVAFNKREITRKPNGSLQLIRTIRGETDLRTGEFVSDTLVTSQSTTAQ